MSFSNDSGIRKLYRRDNQPFAQIPNEAIRDPQITPGAFRLLAYLMSHQDGYDLTYGQIERETGMGRYAINEGIKVLERRGWLRTETTKMSNGQFGPKAWFVLNPSTSTSVGNSAAGDSTTEKPTDKEDNFIKNTKREKVNAQTLQTAFDLFWEAYPRKVGKREAFKAFEKAVQDVSAQVVITGAWNYNNDPYLPPAQFIPYPATWLNRGQWEDGPLPERELTPEEKAARAKARAEADHQKVLEAAEKRRAERERIQAEVAANPPERCDHDRVKVMCRICSPIVRGQK